MTLLAVESLSKSFGGVKAIADLSFAVPRGGVHSVIGPNGAGKTTLFNLVTGLYAPTSGRILLEGDDITGRPANALARLGVTRTFQNLQVCMNMTAIENVMIGAHLRLDQSLLAAVLRTRALRRAERSCREEAIALMHFVGVGGYVDAHASELPYGALKRLEIARSLAARPRLLMLDEPAAGLNPTETAEIELLLKKVVASGVTIVLVEHDMKLVMNVSDHVIVLDYGRKLCEGAPDDVRKNSEVIEAYLGYSS